MGDGNVFESRGVFECRMRVRNCISGTLTVLECGLQCSYTVRIHCPTSVYELFFWLEGGGGCEKRLTQL